MKSRQRLAALNWTPINQSQIKGTVYDGIHEETIYKVTFQRGIKYFSCLIETIQ